MKLKLDSSAYKVFLKTRIEGLENEMETFCKDLDLQTPNVEKRRTLSLYVEESFISKIKSAIKEGYIDSIFSLAEPIREHIAKLEKEHGTLPYLDPGTAIHSLSKRGRGSIDARLFTILRTFKRQILLLKDELDRGDSKV